jgi:sensor domain CHASE-containing protein
MLTLKLIGIVFFASIVFVIFIIYLIVDKNNKDIEIIDDKTNAENMKNLMIERTK